MVRSTKFYALLVDLCPFPAIVCMASQNTCQIKSTIYGDVIAGMLLCFVVDLIDFLAIVHGQDLYEDIGVRCGFGAEIKSFFERIQICDLFQKRIMSKLPFYQ